MCQGAGFSIHQHRGQQDRYIYQSIKLIADALSEKSEKESSKLTFSNCYQQPNDQKKIELWTTSQSHNWDVLDCLPDKQLQQQIAHHDH